MSEERFRDRAEQDALFGDDADFSTNWQAWQGMPQFTHDDLQPYGSIIVHFANADDVRAFEKLIGQPVRPTPRKTKSIWFPKIEIGRAANRRYRDASGDEG